MRILIATSELLPFSKTGGLADMVAALAKSFARLGHEVLVVTPLYRGIIDKFQGMEQFDWKFTVPLGPRTVEGGALLVRLEPGLRVLFVRQPEFYDREGLYSEHGQDYADNAERYIFFSKCVANLARYLPEPPELVHLHDWQTGLVPLLINHQQAHDGWNTPPLTCLTVHNLAYQGSFPVDYYQLTNLPWDYYHDGTIEFHHKISLLKAGLKQADQVTTVSPTYAREILTPALGCGLDGVLRQRREAVLGILNGVDYEEWRTLGNPALHRSYTPGKLQGKGLDKRWLQKTMGLAAGARIPLFGTVSRLAHQKGMDIMLPALEHHLREGVQFVLLGSGDRTFEAAFQLLAAQFPKQVAIRTGMDPALAHQIEAGCDFFLMPSHFEPCGLNQMYSLRYGTVPIVRATGGLDDTVVDATEDLDKANGIKFHEYSARALAKAMQKGRSLFRIPGLLKHYRTNGMTADNSWKRSALAYEAKFREWIKRRPAP